MSSLLTERLEAVDARHRREERRRVLWEIGAWVGGFALAVGLLWSLLHAGTRARALQDTQRARFWEHQLVQEAACRTAGGFPILTWGSYKGTEGPVYSGCMPLKAER